MKITKAWPMLAISITLGAAALCPVQAHADSSPADSGSQEKKGGDIIVQPPIIIPDNKKKK